MLVDAQMHRARRAKEKYIELKNGSWVVDADGDFGIRLVDLGAVLVNRAEGEVEALLVPR